MVISSGNNFILTDDGKDNKGVPIATEYDIRTDEAAYRPHQELEIGMFAKIADNNLKKAGSSEVVLVDCSVVYKEYDPEFKKTYYYFFAVHEDDEMLNNMVDDCVPVKFYKLLESTSPLIIL